jgi:hypothetical protein
MIVTAQPARGPLNLAKPGAGLARAKGGLPAKSA